LRAAEYYFLSQSVKKIRINRRNRCSTKVAIQKIVLDLAADQEYTYASDVGSLKAYEKHDARFLLHLLLRGDAAPI